MLLDATAATVMSLGAGNVSIPIFRPIFSLSVLTLSQPLAYKSS